MEFKRYKYLVQAGTHTHFKYIDARHDTHASILAVMDDDSTLGSTGQPVLFVEDGDDWKEVTLRAGRDT